MKFKHLLFFLFLFVGPIAKCDTLDFWCVYLNDELIGQFYELSNEKIIRLQLKELNESDEITVRYGSDHPCGECIYILTVMAEVKRHLPETQSKEHFSKLSISLKEILEAAKMEQIQKFYFYHSERDAKPYLIKKINGQFLFTLILI